MTGWNLPPGVNVRDLPGNTPEDEAMEARTEAIYDELLDVPFLRDPNMSLEDRDRYCEQLCKAIEKLMDKSYMMGYEEGGNDARMAAEYEASKHDND
jgi:hypothetical protein